MIKTALFFLLPVTLCLLMATSLSAQPWKLVKEKDGIKVYTRNEPSSDLKSFKGEADFNTDMKKLCSRIGNLDNLDWWDDDVKELNILHHERDKLIQYYFIYDSPWPFTDRDLCVEANIIKDTDAGLLIVHAVPYLCGPAEKKEIVRIKNYWQQWTMQDMGNGIFHVTLEGFLDPGGNIPPWLYNMVITDTPVKIIRNLRESVTSE
jgi:hypothetical protein